MLSELKGRAPVRQKTHALEGLQLNQVIFSTTGVGGNPWRNNLQTSGNPREDPKTTWDGITLAQLTEIQQPQHTTAFTLPGIGHTEVCLYTHTPRYPILYKICICVGFCLFAFGFQGSLQQQSHSIRPCYSLLLALWLSFPTCLKTCVDCTVKKKTERKEKPYCYNSSKKSIKKQTQMLECKAFPLLCDYVLSLKVKSTLKGFKVSKP